MPPLVVLFVGVAGIIIVGGLLSFAALARRRKAASSAMERAPAHDLARRARQAIETYGWRALPSAGPFFRVDEDWTDARLAAALELLYRELTASDGSPGRTGRDSGEFAFYDSGLSSILEVVAARG
jgi:hypothetical protein